MPTDLLWSGVTGVLAWVEGPVTTATAGGTLDSLVAHLVAAVLFGAFMVLGRLVPFSIRNEIEHDQNVALAIIMASIILGISLIIAAAILG
jgi:uncharacterized membrane protein YjfL (UPF0719 family)